MTTECLMLFKIINIKDFLQKKIKQKRFFLFKKINKKVNIVKETNKIKM